MTAVEVNFDGLVGPTHNYAGLSHGNVASMRHRGAVSNPREAALQGLAKMRALATMGVPQAVLPPQERPSVETLRSLGFGGDDRAVIASAAKAAPELLARCSSASSMWTANAATVAPSVDTADGRVHFTVANLAGNVHRSIEPPQTWRTLRAVFGDERHFAVHAALPSGGRMGDEGAANHTRLAPAPGKRGLHLFAYGHSTLTATADGGPSRFASRQALEASEAVARLHGLRERAVVFARQSPEAIDAGVFHNDVICVGHENVLFLHERAFVETRKTVAELRGRFAAVARGAELQVIEVPERKVPLADAVRSYLFNSQLVTVGRGRMALIVPADCRSVPRVWEYLEGLVGAGRTPIGEVHAFDLRQSMRNGGGPACLRLRVVLNAAERAAVAPGVFVDGTVHDRLAAWVKKHYRDRLAPADLADPALLEESRRALDELTTLLGLGRSLYPFQR